MRRLVDGLVAWGGGVRMPLNRDLGEKWMSPTIYYGCLLPNYNTKNKITHRTVKAGRQKSCGEKSIQCIMAIIVIWYIF